MHRSQGKAFEDMNKDELDELEDDIDEDDEKVFEMYRWDNFSCLALSLHSSAICSIAMNNRAVDTDCIALLVSVSLI